MESPTPPLSMQRLEPSPLDSPSPLVERDRQLATEAAEEPENNSSVPRNSSTAYPGLYGGHGAIFYLTRVQRFSSYAFSIFTTLHLCNVSLIPAITRSVAGSETYLLQTREIYQTPLTEPLLVGLPVLAHVTSGVALRLLRRSQNMKRYGGSESARSMRKKSPATAVAWPAMSYISLSGYVFTLAFAGHVGLNRVLPLIMDGGNSNVGLAFIAHGFSRHPVTAGVAYAGLIVIASGHVVWGWAKWFGAAPSTKGWLGQGAGEGRVMLDPGTRKQRRSRWLSVHGIAATATCLWAVGGLGVVARGGATTGWLGKLYDDLFASVGM